MDRSFYFAARRWPTRFAIQINSALELDYIASFIFHDFIALDDISVFQAHFATGPESKIFWRWGFHEIVTLDVKLATERNFALTGAWIFGIVDCIELFNFSLGIIRQHNLDRPQHSESARGCAIELVAHCMLQYGHVSHA